MYGDNLQQTPGCPQSSRWHSDTRKSSPPPLPPPETSQRGTETTWWSPPQHMSALQWQGQAQSPGTDLGWRWSELYCPPVDLTRQWMRPGTRDKPLAVYYCQFSIVLTNWGNTLIWGDCFLITSTFSSIINTIFCSLMRWWWVQGAEGSHYIQQRWQCSAVQYGGGKKQWGFPCNFNSTVY